MTQQASEGCKEEDSCDYKEYRPDSRYSFSKNRSTRLYKPNFLDGELAKTYDLSLAVAIGVITNLNTQVFKVQIQDFLHWTTLAYNVVLLIEIILTLKNHIQTHSLNVDMPLELVDKLLTAFVQCVT